MEHHVLAALAPAGLLHETEAERLVADRRRREKPEQGPFPLEADDSLPAEIVGPEPADIAQHCHGGFITEIMLHAHGDNGVHPLHGAAIDKGEPIGNIFVVERERRSQELKAEAVHGLERGDCLAALIDPIEAIFKPGHTLLQTAVLGAHDLLAEDRLPQRVELRERLKPVLLVLDAVDATLDQIETPDQAQPRVYVDGRRNVGLLPHPPRAAAKLESGIALAATELRDLVEAVGLIEAELVIGTDTAIAGYGEVGDRLRLAEKIGIEGEFGVDDVGVKREAASPSLEIGHDDRAVQRIDEIDGVGVNVEGEAPCGHVSLYPHGPGVEPAVKGPGRRGLGQRRPGPLTAGSTPGP